ncbi:unnamed protein product [Didymodactylos carnosus]|uniref:Uncharacterized protein n=1 Tax=Didymodactylos carnosus TaxID=1234261 RepID=A0A815IRV2_9BILA|nr:unnamed protein product [Didymodactylos carnosus]CAF1369611.1 unnamed protein product [Didymodactylos carnosus]CAF3770474.1 unnamed protein product [Didymodactylos carnosus]CAF4254629.1 unnamed protein product [Didymodactylos carnosus]
MAIIFSFPGKIDCFNGDDEQNCFQMEINECDPKTEYRCSNGQCIPERFFFDLSVDCLDGSDEYPSYDRACPRDPSYFCEDHMSSLGKFSCGGGYFKLLRNHTVRSENNKCIPRRFLMHEFKQCTDGSDESFGERCRISGSYNCEYIRGGEKINQISFPKICNGLLDMLTLEEYNETDETNCDDLILCIKRYTLCDSVWNCPKAVDELNCPGSMSHYYCSDDQEHVCFHPEDATLGC